jgi:endonuclease/exonuclease/phosphatase family metal-dependent hydrolase
MAVINTMPSAIPVATNTPVRIPRRQHVAAVRLWPQCGLPHGDHGNALLSKFPIRAHDNLDVSVHGNEERGLLHCQLEVPGHEQVHTVCVHLGLREGIVSARSAAAGIAGQPAAG